MACGSSKSSRRSAPPSTPVRSSGTRPSSPRSKRARSRASSTSTRTTARSKTPRGDRAVHGHDQRPARHQHRDRAGRQQPAPDRGGSRLGGAGARQGIRRPPARPARRGLLAARLRQRQYGKLTSLRAVEVIYVAQFESAATPQQIDFYRRAVEDPQIRRVENMRDEAVETGGQGRVPGDATTWFQASSVELDRLRGVEQRLSADVVATSVSIKANADHRALLYTLLLLAALALSVGLSLGMARSLIRRLGRLKDVAHEVAERKLPGVVNRLREGESVDLAAESATPIDAYARDEIGQLGEAFSFVHQVAVQLAGREAALRRSVGDMFL